MPRMFMVMKVNNTGALLCWRAHKQPSSGDPMQGHHHKYFGGGQ
jgi:hypothetical protein